MLGRRHSHQLVYLSTAWRSIHPLDRAHIILVAERLKPMAYCGVSDLGDVREFISRGLDVLVIQATGETRWIRSGLDPLVFPSRVYTVCNSAKTLKVVTGGLSTRLQGRLLGYPRCCVDEYMRPTYEEVFTAEAIRSVTDRWAFRFALEAVGLFLDDKSIPREFYYLMPSQTPHSVACLPSLKLLRRWASVIEKHDPEAAETLFEINRRLFAKLQAVAAKLRQRGFTSSAQLLLGNVHSL